MKQLHALDILTVRNILVGDDKDIHETVPVGAKPIVSWNTKDFFQVRWNGRLLQIAPGMTKQWPRYLADHFAKYLIDYMLLQKEQKTGVKGDKAARQKLYDQIVGEAVDYYADSHELPTDDRLIPKGPGHVIDPLEK